MDEHSQDYFGRRERAERAAAKKTASLEARRVHQELAQRYAALLQQRGGVNPEEIPMGRPKLSIVASPGS